MASEARLIAALSQMPITRAYLFGSCAGGNHGPLSDVDVAVLPDDSAVNRLALVGQIHEIAPAAYGVPRADVVLLDEAPPAIAFHAIDGRVLFGRDPDRRAAFESRIMRLYQDRDAFEEAWMRSFERRHAEGSA
ncbi:MAG: type VII toxin-antitoxin system MntA family adenylyltransferase antitoxin [Thermoplasmatota archaeon]